MNNNLQILVWAGLWYFFSGCTLFLNKYILSSLKVDPNALGAYQMCITCVLGGIKVFGARAVKSATEAATKKTSDDEDPLIQDIEAVPPRTEPLEVFSVPLSKNSQSNNLFVRDMALVGVMRCLTVVLGLVAVKYVAVSFVETVKASAPFFTVGFAYLLLGEQTSLKLAVTLVPVVGGLVLCSATELSFNMIGFLAAVTCNTVDCIQNVFSKKLLAQNYTPVELQFYTSGSALIVQLFLWIAMYMMQAPGEVSAGDTVSHPHLDESTGGLKWTWTLILYFAWDGIAYHLQSVSVYTLMSLVSPVTVSVANTFKRALLILVSVFVFKNAVSIGAGVGTMITFLGVLWYNDTIQKEKSKPKVAL